MEEFAILPQLFLNEPSFTSYQNPGWWEPSHTPTFAVNDAVNHCKVINVEDDAKEVAADKHDDNAEKNRSKIEI